MGLDISWYSGTAPAPESAYDESVYPESGYTRAYVNSDFPAQADGLASGVYSFAKSGDFRAGSYSGYNEWREELAKLAGYPARAEHDKPHSYGAWESEAKEGPFFEIISFSDCEGVIGPKTSAKLASDFATYQEKADALRDDGFSRVYAHFRKAFETVANNGFVSFH